MNVVIVNQNQNIVDELRIDTLKRLTGTFDINDLFREISTLNYDKVILDITALKKITDINTFKSLTSFIKNDNLILVIGNLNWSREYIQALIELGIYNFAYNSNHIASLYDYPNTYEDAIVLINDEKNKPRIIGIKNITKHAGATTLTYMLKKYIKKTRTVVAIEIDRLDFNFLYDKELISIPENKLEITVEKYYNNSIILIDLNESEKALSMCDDVLYLVEPTTIKINQLMMVNPTVFQNLKDKKVILNKSNLDNSELREFESESHLKIFYNLPSINERKKNNQYLNDLILKLNL